MKSYCLLLVVLCSVLAIQGAYAGKLRTKAAPFTPKDYYIDITEFDGIQARDVGVGAEGTLWYISNTKDDDDYSIYRIQPGSETPEKIQGNAQYISVANDGNAYVVTGKNELYKYVGKPDWQKISGTTAFDVSCSPDGNLFHIGTSSGLYFRNRANTGWQKLDGAGVRIAGGPGQSVWHANADKKIYRRYPGGNWEQISGLSATDIAIGANGLVWILTTGSVPNQFAVFDEVKQTFINVPLDAYLAKSGYVGEPFSTSPTTRIAVYPNGDLVGVRADFSMFRLRFQWSY